MRRWWRKTASVGTFQSTGARNTCENVCAPSEGDTKTRESCPPSEGGKATVTGETLIHGALETVTPPRTFGRWDENAGKLHTFGRWKGAEWNALPQQHRIAGNAAVVETGRKGNGTEEQYRKRKTFIRSCLNFIQK